MRLTALAGLLLLISVALPSSHAFMPGMPKKPEKKAPAVPSDIPFIRCQACEAIVKQSIKMVKTMRSELKPGQKVRPSQASCAV